MPIFFGDTKGSSFSILRKDRLAASRSRFAVKRKSTGDNYYGVKPQLRETVIFAPQNLLKDPRYSPMALVSCHNLLIYLEPAAQDKVLSLAHFALREGGYPVPGQCAKHYLPASRA